MMAFISFSLLLRRHTKLAPSHSHVQNRTLITEPSNWYSQDRRCMFIFKDEQQSNASAGLKEPVPDQFSTRWQTAREALRWRGLLFSSLLAAREVLRPIMYWHAWHIFHTDLRRPLMEPYAKGRVVVKFSAAKENLEGVPPQISAMGNLPLENVHSRFDRGDAAAVAYVGREPAG